MVLWGLLVLVLGVIANFYIYLSLFRFILVGGWERYCWVLLNLILFENKKYGEILMI